MKLIIVLIIHMNNENIYNKIDNNNISNENNINIINEESIDNKYEEERINRIKELINNSLSIDYKAILQKKFYFSIKLFIMGKK